MQLTFEATNFHDLRLKVYRFLEEAGIDTILAKTLDESQLKFNYEGKQADAATPLAAKAEKKPGRPRKTEEVAAPQTEVTPQNVTAVLNPAPVSPSFAKIPMPDTAALAAAVAMTEPAVTKFTKEDCNSELQKVNSVHGLAECKRILLEFGCARLSELRESQFDGFIALCRKLSEKQV